MEPHAEDPAEEGAHPNGSGADASSPAREMSLHLLRMVETRLEAAGIVLQNEGNRLATRLQLQVIGSTMGTRGELASLVNLLDVTGTRPVIDQVLPMEKARDGFAAMASGDIFGKVVFTR